MKPVFNKNKLYLLLVYLILSLPLFFIFPVFVGESLQLFTVAILLLLIIITYEPLLHTIQETRGYITPNDELSFFSAFVDLNKKIHKTLAIDDVMILVRDMLEDRVRVRKVVFLINDNIMSPGQGSVIEKTQNISQFYVWNEIKNPDYLTTEFCQDLLKLKGISPLEKVGGNVSRAMNETETSLIIPIIQNGKMLSVIMVGYLNQEKEYSDFELQMYEYLTNQLSIVLDRIRIYDQIMRKTVMDHAEKMQVMQSLSANIAHEMRTPLSGIRASISGIETYLPDLIEAYLSAESHEPERYPAIRDDHLATLKQTPGRITLMIDQASAVIDMLLMNLRDNSLDKRQFSNCSAANCVEQAVDRYPFKSGERKKVSIDLKDDFTFAGVETLFIYVIFNLLKNALYSIKSAEKGDISISLRIGTNFNEVHFMDTGEGIEQGVIDRIFEGFFTTKSDGTGAGLAYCKRTLESFGGNIRCISEIGNYTEFVMQFPVLEKM